MSLLEKFPKDYSGKILQRIYEAVLNKLSKSEKKQDDAIKDLSKELSTKIDTEVAKVSKGGDGDRPGVPTHIPAPQDLTVKEFFNIVICTVAPFKFWKYLTSGVKGYEFYGSYNNGFDPQSDDYTQTGTHLGIDGSSFLYTYEEGNPNNFIFEPRIARASNQLTLENVTSGDSGPIEVLSYVGAKTLLVSGVSWDTGDTWRIKKYPSNKIFSFGALAIYTKTFKTGGLDFYVKARTIGKGKSFSTFTSQSTSSDEAETMPAPTGFTVTQKVRLLTGNKVYWVQDTPYVDVILEWDNLDASYGFVLYEHKFTEEDV